MNNIAIGKDEQGQEYFLDLNKNPHIYIGGTCGSGKSICLHQILINLLNKNKNAQYVLIDPKCVEFRLYRNLKNVSYFEGRNLDEAFNYLEELTREPSRRDIFIFIDELMDIIDTDSDYLLPITRLVKLDPSYHVHVLLATQRPGSKYTIELRKVMQDRLCFMTASNTDSKAMVESYRAQGLNGKGDCIARINGELTHIQCYYFDKELRNKLLEQK